MCFQLQTGLNNKTQTLSSLLPLLIMIKKKSWQPSMRLWQGADLNCEEKKQQLNLDEPPLHSWWALLPPPLDVVVGLRQVHYLAEYWRVTRGDPYDKDIIAEELFPFISSQRFTLKEFVTQPSRWFWFTKNMADFDISL